MGYIEAILYQLLKFVFNKYVLGKLALIAYSLWARTLERAIWYQNEGQILALIFNNIDSSRLFWCMMTMLNE